MFKKDRFDFSEVDLTTEEQQEIIAEINSRPLNKQSDYVKLHGELSATIWQGRVTIYKNETIDDYDYNWDFDDIEPDDEPDDDRLFIDGVPTIKFWNKFWGEEE